VFSTRTTLAPKFRDHNTVSSSDTLWKYVNRFLLNTLNNTVQTQMESHENNNVTLTHSLPAI